MAERTPIPAGAYERLVRQLRADMLRKQFLEQMQAARQAEDMKGRHSVGPDERRPTNPNLISNALLAGTLGGAMSAAGLPAVGLRAGLIGGGLTDATLNAGNPEGGAEISGALAAAGALGRHSIPAAIAALGASSSEAAGMPFHSWMKRLNSLNKVEPTAMYVNPTRAELLNMLKDARETYPTSPTVRLLRDQRSNDVYGVEGSSILHDDMRRHLGMPYEASPGVQGSALPDLESELRFLQSLPIRKAGGGAIKRLGKRAMSAFDELRPSSVAPQGALSVVKNKGGNWLAGSVEDALSGLKKNSFPIDHPLPNEVAQLRRVPGEGGRELFQDPVRGNVFTPEQVAGTLAIESRDGALNQWIEGPLTKYVKTRMASPDDEVRKLAEQGVLHYGGPREAGWQPYYNESVKSNEVLGVSDLAKDWERLTDTSIKGTSVGNVLEKFPKSRIEPWMEKADPASLVYDTRGGQGDVRQSLQNFTGFNHLIDELSNALNPNSGLPPHLQLSPEAVKNLSMEKAVRRVADINAHRAAQQAAANQELANKAMVVREYTDPALPNPKGLRWVELKKGNDTGRLQEFMRDDPRFQIPEAQQVRFNEQAHREASAKGIDAESDERMEYVEGRMRELAEDWARKNPAFEDESVKTLRDQLKYEGDTMGHCVGGYCPDVLEGRSRIFSLRDAKGEPHVTVEVEPNANPYAVSGEAFARLSPAEKAQYREHVMQWRRRNPDIEELTDEHTAQALREAGVPPRPDRIVQIKGKQNRAPNPEYLPFVQDFVRNSPLGGAWSDVGDLGNTGLTGIGGKYFSEPELRKAYDAAGFSIPFEGLGMDYMDMIARKNLQADRADAAFLQALGFDFKPVQKASGGAVTKQPNPADNFQGIIAAIEEALA